MPTVIRITIDGQLLHEFSEGAVLHHVEVTQELNQHFWCRVMARQTLDERFPVEQALGKDMRAEAVDAEGETMGIFSGFVLEAEIDYEISGSFTVRLTGVTKSYKMDVTPRHRYFETGELEPVAQEILDVHSLELRANGVPGGQHQPYLIQWAETDFDFLRRAADDHGCWMRPFSNGIQLVKGFTETQEHPLRWRHEGELVAFQVKGRLRPRSMDGAQYDSAEMKSQAYTDIQEDPPFFGSSSEMVEAVKQESGDKLPSGYVPHRARARELDKYEELLEKESQRSIGGAIVCHGQSRYGKLIAGDTIDVQGATAGFAGKYALTRVTHHWDRHGYANDFEATPWSEYYNAEPQPVRRWHGLVPARVVENADPEGCGRLCVQFYWMAADKKTHWIRSMAPHAGADRGFFFMPEVGDEVVVAFQDGDIERPVVVGSIWNGAHKAPTQNFWGGEYGNDDVKRIVTKSGHRIQLVDKEGKESISLATPNNLKVSMFENSNETGRPMIQIASTNGDIFLSAPDGRIHLKSKFFTREIG